MEISWVVPISIHLTAQDDRGPFDGAMPHPPLGINEATQPLLLLLACALQVKQPTCKCLNLFAVR